MPCGCLCPDESENESALPKSPKHQSTANAHPPTKATSSPSPKTITVSPSNLPQPPTSPQHLSPTSATPAKTPRPFSNTDITLKTQLESPPGSARQAGFMTASPTPTAAMTPKSPPPELSLDPARAGAQSPKPPNATLTSFLIYGQEYSRATVVPTTNSNGPAPLIMSNQTNALAGPTAPRVRSPRILFQATTIGNSAKNSPAINAKSAARYRSPGSRQESDPN